MARLIIIVSGRRGAGKNTFSNMIAVEWMKKVHGIGAQVNPTIHLGNSDNSIWLDEVLDGKSVARRSVSLETGIGTETSIEMFQFRIHAFATLLKIFLRDTMGISEELLFGSQKDKEKLTHLRWENLPLSTRWRNRKSFLHWPRRGLMTAREAMQVFGTDMMRKWDDNIWVRSAMSYAVNSLQKVVVIADGRFPNELDYALQCKALINHQGSLSERRIFMEQHGLFPNLIDASVVIKTVRLTRRPTKDKHKSERAMDHYPLDKFDVVVPPDADLNRMLEFAQEYGPKWFKEAGII